MMVDVALWPACAHMTNIKKKKKSYSPKKPSSVVLLLSQVRTSVFPGRLPTAVHSMGCPFAMQFTWG